ncbi:hypothetical protein G7046_g8046 [Stylonectria norvegica]|nr:hypothetical protein G7046_g8046 [Stylonectria norvegica]
MTEVMKLALGPIPEPHAEPSLLGHSGGEQSAPRSVENYMDDIFLKHGTFEEQWAFVRDHLLPRLLWSLLKVNWKKLKLGQEEILAVGWVYCVGGIMRIKAARADKLRDWPIPLDQTGVRAFMGALGPCRRWIPNCAEISRPLQRLTGQVDWKWGPSEAIAFDILRRKGAEAVELHGFAFDQPVQLYSDASGFGAGCVILQMKDGVLVPILYDSFLFTKCQRNYGTYKRELCAIMEFCRRHGHFFGSFQLSTIFTDHKPLTWFITSSQHDGIYARWVTELRLLRVEIKFIEGKRNAAADGLSRTVFPSKDCEEDLKLDELGTFGEDGAWIWRDGKGGYLDLLKAANEKGDGEKEPEGLVSSLKVGVEAQERTWVWSDGPEGSELEEQRAPRAMGTVSSRLGSVGVSDPVDMPSLTELATDAWYVELIHYLRTGKPSDPLDRHEHRRLSSMAAQFCIAEGALWRKRHDDWLRCLPRTHVAEALRKAYDEAGHFGPDATRRRLSNHVFWPGMAKDVVMGIDHVGPFPVALSGARYILVVVDYFSRYAWLFVCEGTTATEALSHVEAWIAHGTLPPLAFYSDPGSAFISDEFLAKAMNSRLIPLLGYSPNEILFGLGKRSPCAQAYPGCGEAAVRQMALEGKMQEPSARLWPNLVLQHVAVVEGNRSEVMETGNRELEARRARHAQCRERPFAPGDLVMVVQEGKPPKLQPRWRGLFRVLRRAGRATYRLGNIDATRLTGANCDQHEDHLKLFQPRSGYLRSDGDDWIPFAQLLRRARLTRGLPQVSESR